MAEKEYIEREKEMNVCEHPPITQVIKGGEKSICWSCFHWEICVAKENQPCIRCTRYIPAANVVEVRHARWILDAETGVPICSECHSGKPTRCVCSSVIQHNLKNYEIRYCYYCGAKMDGGADNA